MFVNVRITHPFFNHAPASSQHTPWLFCWLARSSSSPLLMGGSVVSGRVRSRASKDAVVPVADAPPLPLLLLLAASSTAVL